MEDKATNNKSHLFKKGFDPRRNYKGRPKRISLKEYARKYLENMTDEERVDYLNSIDPEIVWKMSEGNPPQKNTIDGEIKLPMPIIPKTNAILSDFRNQQDNSPNEKD